MSKTASQARDIRTARYFERAGVVPCPNYRVWRLHEPVSNGRLAEIIEALWWEAGIRSPWLLLSCGGIKRLALNRGVGFRNGLPLKWAEGNLEIGLNWYYFHVPSLDELSYIALGPATPDGELWILDRGVLTPGMETPDKFPPFIVGQQT